MPSPDLPASIPHNWNLPEAITRRLGVQAGRQRAMSADDHLLIILHAPPGEDHVHRQARLFWRDADGRWRSNDGGGGLPALNALLDEYVAVLADMEEHEHDGDDAAHYFNLLERLSPIVRASRHLHSALQEARQLSGDDRDVISARDRAYQVERAAELQYAETKHDQELCVNRRVEQQAVLAQETNAAAHRLNMMAAFFLPLATISAVFGTNLQHGWEGAEPPIPFLLHVLIGLIAGAVLTVSVVGGGRTLQRSRDAGHTL